MAILLAVGVSAQGSPTLFLEPADGGLAEYVPGQESTVRVHLVLPGAANLASWYMELLMVTADASLATHATFGPAAAPQAGYVFGDGPTDRAWFAAQPTVIPAQSRYHLALSDFHDADSDFNLDPVTTVANANDVVATVHILITPDLTGDLTLSIESDTNFFELDTPESAPIEGYEDVRTGLTGLIIHAVPEPASATFALLAASFCLLRRRTAARKGRDARA